MAAMLLPIRSTKTARRSTSIGHRSGEAAARRSRRSGPRPRTTVKPASGPGGVPVVRGGLHERRPLVLGPGQRVGQVALAGCAPARRPRRLPPDLAPGAPRRKLQPSPARSSRRGPSSRRRTSRPRRGWPRPLSTRNLARPASPTRSVSVVAVSTNTAVRSTPVTSAPAIAAIRLAPPMPQPTSSSRTPGADLHPVEEVCRGIGAARVQLVDREQVLRPERGRCRRRPRPARARICATRSLGTVVAGDQFLHIHAVSSGTADDAATTLCLFQSRLSVASRPRRPAPDRRPRPDTIAPPALPRRPARPDDRATQGARGTGRDPAPCRHGGHAARGDAGHASPCSARSRRPCPRGW